MNILHVIARYVPAIGGAEKHFHEFSRRLARDGHRVRVVTTDALDPEYFWSPAKARIEIARETIDGVQIVRVPIRHWTRSELIYRGIRRALSILSDAHAPIALLNRVAVLAPYVPSFSQILREETSRYDLVAGMNIAYEGLLISAFEFERDHRIPFVLFPLTHLGDARAAKFYTMRHQRALVKKSDAVFVQTRSESDFYRGVEVNAQRLIRLGPGVEPAEIAGGQAQRARAQLGLDQRVVLFLGTVSYDKGASTLLDAMKKVWTTDAGKITVVFAGAVVDEWRHRFHSDPRVRMLGVVSEEMKNDLLAACDVLALPSRVDSFGIVLLEAWLYGKPVIAAQARGLADVVEDERDGLLVPFGDVDALANALQRVLDHPGWSARLGARGRGKVLAEHTWESKYQIMRQVYEQLAARASHERLGAHQA